MTDRRKKKQRKAWLLAAVIAVLSGLIFAKCYSLLEWKLHYIVPLGISYYTFSAVGYLADVYWGKEPAEKNPLKLLLFLLFFPKILQGPIAKHRTLGPQLSEGHAFDYQNFCFGMQLAVWGYFKKMVIADRIGVFTGSVFENYRDFGGTMIVLSIVLSAIQLYCDFSGCMDIAGGISRMVGIKLDKNFDHPFASKSAAEFWRRWHVSLGVWFKDYVYMPLAISPKLIRFSGNLGKKHGRRVGRAVMTIVPTGIVWLLTGLWHGTGWNYVLWGVYWAVIIVVSTVFAPELKLLAEKLHIDTKTIAWQRFQMVRTFALFCISRLLTVQSKLEVTGEMISTIFTEPKLWQLFDKTIYAQGLVWQEFVIMLAVIVLLWFVELWQMKGSVRERIAKWPLVLRCAVYALSVIVILVFGIYGPGYDASSFVYMQF